MAESGVTYYKLKELYSNDETKNCSLIGEEIDSNFHFLRGYDFSSITFEEGIITLTRLNGEQLTADTSSYIESGTTKIDFSGTTFNPETGELLLVINGKECSIEGFNTLADSAITMIEQEIAIRESEFGQLDEGQSALTESLQEEINIRNSKDNELETKISENYSTFTAETCYIWQEISAETSARTYYDNIIASALDNEIVERKAKDNELASVINTEKEERKAAITTEKERAESAETVLTNNLATEVARAQSAETVLTNNLATEVARAQSAETYLESLINGTSITEEIEISKNSPLYHLVKDFWDDDKILTGTTLTEFVKTLLTMEDNKLIYFISTPNDLTDFTTEGELDISTFSTTAATVSDFLLPVGANDRTYIIALPWDKNLIYVGINNELLSDIDETFFSFKKLLIKDSSYKKAYNVYYYSDTIAVGTGQTFKIKIG